MSVAGTMKGGVVVLDEPQPVPDGTRVQVVFVPPQLTKPVDDGPTLRNLLDLAGTVTDLPPDMADQHDHYIHGTPRR
jgi:hypothetical protein